MNHSPGGSQVLLRMGGGVVMKIYIGGFQYIDGGAVEDSGAAGIT